MEKYSKAAVPYYNEINALLAAIPVDYRSANPLFYCLRLTKDEGVKFMSPFRRGFYFIGLLTNTRQTKITFDNKSETSMDSFLVVQSPGQLYSFYRDSPAYGYTVYFKPECLSFFKLDIDKEFPFFDILHTNFFKFNKAKFDELSPYFEDMFAAYEAPDNDQYKIAGIKLLLLLYQLKKFASFGDWEERFITPQQKLLKKFILLVNNHYNEKRTVEEYADLLFITPKHLSQSIKAASGRNALLFINNRIMTEAKSLILYSDFDIAEIAYQLNFSDPANFGKFFKKQAGITPLEYRKNPGK